MTDDITERIIRLSAEHHRPDGTSLRTLPLEQANRLATEENTHVRDIEIEALRNNIVPTRYIRNMSTYTIGDQLRLLKATVSVVGLGGLGGMVVEILARAGVGKLILIDGDRFEEHNLNRQMLSSPQSLNLFKAHAAARRVAEINSAVSIEAHTTFLDDKNAKHLLESSLVVVDCLDSIPVRFVLEDVLRIVGIPLVSGAVAGLTGRVTTIFPQDEGSRRIYGPRRELDSPTGVETLLGNLPQTVVMVAAMQSAEVLKLLTGKTTQLLRNKLWIMDLTDNLFEVFDLS